MKYLKQKNLHERDPKLSFDENLHQYTYNKNQILTSVTTVIAEFFPVFNPDNVIKKMKSNKASWRKNKLYGMTDDEIKETWKLAGQDASNEGSRLHEDIEKYYNYERTMNDSIEFQFFLNFQKENQLNMYRTEWSIYNEDISIAGTIDGAALTGRKDKDGKIEIVLYDWKRTKQIQRNNCYSYSTFPELKHLNDNNYTKYSLQLNMYRYILESKYDQYVVKDMYLVCFHPNNKNNDYLLYSVPKLDKEIEIIVNHFKKKNI